MFKNNQGFNFADTPEASKEQKLHRFFIDNIRANINLTGEQKDNLCSKALIILNLIEDIFLNTMEVKKYLTEQELRDLILHIETTGLIKVIGLIRQGYLSVDEAIKLNEQQMNNFESFPKVLFLVLVNKIDIKKAIQLTEQELNNLSNLNIYNLIISDFLDIERAINLKKQELRNLSHEGILELVIKGDIDINQAMNLTEKQLEYLTNYDGIDLMEAFKKITRKQQWKVLEVGNSLENFQEIIPNTIAKGKELMETLYKGGFDNLLDLELTDQNAQLDYVGRELYEELVQVDSYLDVNQTATTSILSSAANTLGQVITSNVPLGYFINFTPVSSSSNQTSTNNVTEKENKRKYYLAIITSLMWEIYKSNPTESGELMKRGSYTVIDPDNKLYNLLHDYVKLSTNCNAAGFLSINGGNSFAYARNPQWHQSSHHLNHPNQFGIDMRFSENNKEALPILPEKSTHLLFGKLNINGKEVTFIKFEPHGLGNMNDIYSHLLDYSKKRTEEISSDEKTTRREKDVPKELLAIYKEFCELTISELTFNPKIPIHEMFRNIQDRCSSSAEINFNDPQLEKQIILHKKFLVYLKEHNLLDNIEIRTGNEIIVDNHRYLRKPSSNMSR